MFFKPSSKYSCGFFNTLLTTLNPITLTSTYHSNILCDTVLILEGHQEVLDGIASFEVYLYPIFVENVFKALTKPFSLRHYHVDFVSFVVVRFVVAIHVLGGIVFDCFTLIFSLLRTQLRKLLL